MHKLTNSSTVGLTWSFESLVNSKQISNAPRTFEWEIPTKVFGFWLAGVATNNSKAVASIAFCGMHKLGKATAKLKYFSESLGNSKQIENFKNVRKSLSVKILRKCRTAGYLVIIRTRAAACLDTTYLFIYLFFIYLLIYLLIFSGASALARQRSSIAKEIW